jgi:hypothetical protein
LPGWPSAWRLDGGVSSFRWNPLFAPHFAAIELALFGTVDYIDIGVRSRCQNNVLMFAAGFVAYVGARFNPRAFVRCSARKLCL